MFPAQSENAKSPHFAEDLGIRRCEKTKKHGVTIGETSERDVKTWDKFPVKGPKDLESGDRRKKSAT